MMDPILNYPAARFAMPDEDTVRRQLWPWRRGRWQHELDRK